MNSGLPANSPGGKAETPWQVRPLSAADVLTDALRLMRSDFLRLCAIVAILLVPANVVIAVAIYLFMRHIGRVPTLEPDVALLGMLYYFLLLMGAAMLWGLIKPFSQVALVRGITDRYLGHPVRIGRAYRWMADNVWMVMGTVVLAALIIGAATTLFLLPGALAAFLLMLTVPVMVTEGRGGMYAIQRSAQLVWKNFGKMLLLVVVTWMLGTTISSLPQLLTPQPAFQPESGTADELFQYYNATALTTAIATALAGITQSVIAALRGAVYLLAYFDARCRSEGFDVEFEARKVGIWGFAPVPPPPPTVPPPPPPPGAPGLAPPPSPPPVGGAIG